MAILAFLFSFRWIPLCHSKCIVQFSSLQWLYIWDQPKHTQKSSVNCIHSSYVYQLKSVSERWQGPNMCWWLQLFMMKCFFTAAWISFLNSDSHFLSMEECPWPEPKNRAIWIAVLQSSMHLIPLHVLSERNRAEITYIITKGPTSIRQKAFPWLEPGWISFIR